MSSERRYAAQLSALGSPLRLKILRFVVQAAAGQSSAGEIQQHVDLAASTLSHHLKRLVDAGLLVSRTEGTYHFYGANYSSLQALTAYLWQDCCRRAPRRPAMRGPNPVTS